MKHFSLGHFIKHKQLISEEWISTYPSIRLEKTFRKKTNQNCFFSPPIIFCKILAYLQKFHIFHLTKPYKKWLSHIAHSVTNVLNSTSRLVANVRKAGIHIAHIVYRLYSYIAHIVYSRLLPEFRMSFSRLKSTSQPLSLHQCPGESFKRHLKS